MSLRLSIITLLLIAHASQGQQVIGVVNFQSLHQEGKPSHAIWSTIQVFEDNVKARGKKISLYLEVLPATTTGERQAPMFIIMGGPGQAATDQATFFSDIFRKINQTSDIVLIDQRGTGKSNPLLLNAEVNFFQDYFRDDLLSRDIIQRGYDFLSKRNNLRNFGTGNAVLDLEEIRKLMGYNKINLYGTSYGTRVALAYIGKFPGRVRTATLKGLTPDDLVFPATFADDAQRSLDLLLNDCASKPDCHTTYPALREEILNVLEQKLPAKVEIVNPETQKNESIQLTPGVVSMTLRSLLMSPSGSKNIPFIFHEAFLGNWSPLANSIISIKKSYLHGVYDGMTLCVICHEDYGRLARLKPVNSRYTFLGDYWITRVMQACTLWNPTKFQAPRQLTRKQSIPALLISGNRDGATPPANGHRVLEYFPNGKHVIVPEGSHSFDGMRNCVEEMICEFVKVGNVRGIKTDCVNSIKFPDYKLN